MVSVGSPKISLIIGSVILVGMIVSILFLPLATNATVEIGGQMDKFEKGAYGTSGAEKNLPLEVGRYIQSFLSVLGIILVIIMVYAGFLWMTAGGNSEQVDKAKAWIRNGIIGLAILLLAYVISSYVITKLTEETTSAPTPEQATHAALQNAAGTQSSADAAQELIDEEGRLTERESCKSNCEAQSEVCESRCNGATACLGGCRDAVASCQAGCQ